MVAWKLQKRRGKCKADMKSVHLEQTKKKKRPIRPPERYGQVICCDYFFPLGLPQAYSHHARSVQFSQSGLRDAHTRRPWKMSQ